MRNFSDFLTEPRQPQHNNVNEFAFTILAFSCLALAMNPLLNKLGDAAIAHSKKEKSTNIWDFLMSVKKNKEDKKEIKKEDTFNELVAVASKTNKEEKDKTVQAKNDALIKMVTACSYDKDGKEIPLEDRINKMKDVIPEDQFEQFKKDVNDEYEKTCKDPKFKKALAEVHSNIDPKEMNQIIEDNKSGAADTQKQLEEDKKKQEEYDKKVEELKNKLKDADGDDKEKLTKELNDLEKNPPKTLINTITPPATTDPKKDEETTTDPKKDEDKKPEDYSNDEIEKMQDELSELDPEKDKDKIKEKEDLLKSIAKAKGKSEDEFIMKSDTDETGNPRQHKTGPRGGKYYRVKHSGSWGPWNSDTNECISLKDYLIESMR